MNNFYTKTAAFFLAALLVMINCVPAKDINLVKPNHISKDVLDGEWIYRAAVVDKQYHNSSAFIGSECDADRVKFKITKDMLYAYRSYEKSENSEVINPGQQTMLAAFKIFKHFDIRRQYNKNNKLENNVIEENDFDRPWHERQYIRVDWSNNLAPEMQCNNWFKSLAKINIVKNSNNDPTDPFRVRVYDNYFETTMDIAAKPQNKICNYIGDWNCHGANLKMKFSFKRIPQQNTYEPRSYKDNIPVKVGLNNEKQLCIDGEKDCSNLSELWTAQTKNGTKICNPEVHDIDKCSKVTIPIFSRFGYFRTEKIDFDRQEGFTHSNREQLINRWNIWQNYKDDAGNVLPLNKRVPKPIIYHLNVQFPPSLYQTAQDIADDWSVAFSDTVAQLYNQCSRKLLIKYIEKYSLKEKMSKMGFAVLTESNLKQACFKLGEISQKNNFSEVFMSGDWKQIEKIYGKLLQIKINSCNIEDVKEYIEKYDLSDVVKNNGFSEINLNNLEKVCAVIEWYSNKKDLQDKFDWQRLGDLRYNFLNFSQKAELAGPLGYGPSATDPLTGEIINANANIYGPSIDNYSSWGADIVQWINGNISDDEIAGGLNVLKHVQNNLLTGQKKISKTKLANFEKLFDERASKYSENNYLIDLPISSLRSNWKILKESGFEENYLVSDEMVKLMKAEFIDDENMAKELAKPSFWSRSLMPSKHLLHGKSLWINESKQPNKTISPHQYMMEKEEFFAKRNICFMAESIEPAVIELATHLKGKSYDEAYNYIRSSVFRAVAAHELGHTLGLRHNFEGSTDALNYFPNYWGVDTGDHKTSTASNRKQELEYSSIMDYHQRFNSDFGGIGLYDKAAIKFGYGNLIEVFDEADTKFVPENWLSNLHLFHYSDLPYLFSGHGIDESLGEHYVKVRNNFQNGDSSAKIDIKALGFNANVHNFYKRTNISFDDYKKHYIYNLLGNQNGISIKHAVPYRYCSDGYAWGGSLTCNRWDKGASSQEIVQNAIDMYELYYPFNNFRRDKIHFGIRSYMGRLYSRTYQPMLNSFRYMYRYRRSSTKIWPLMQDWSKASIKGLDFFARVLQTIEPGEYCYDQESKLYKKQSDNQQCDDKVNVPLGVGRWYNTKWSNEYFFKPDSIGHMYDKLLALQALTDSTAFFSRDFSSSLSRGAQSIGYYRIFDKEMIKLFTDITLGNMANQSPYITKGDKGVNIKYRSLLDKDLASQSLKKIEASSSWVLRYYALVLPMLNYTSSVDKQLDYVKRASVSIVGSANDPQIKDAVNSITFADPLGGVMYRAFAPEGKHLAPGYLLLENANDFVNSSNSSNEQNHWYGIKKMVDQLYKDYKNIAATSTSSSEIEEIKNRYEKYKHMLKVKNIELYDKVQLIDMARNLSDLLQYSG